MEDTNLFWFGLILWVAGTVFVFSLLGSKTIETEPLVFEHEGDNILRDRLTQVGITSWQLLARKAGLRPQHLYQLRRGKIEQLTFLELEQLAATLNWNIEELLHHFGVTFPSLGTAFQEIGKLHQQGRQLYREKTELLQKIEQLEGQLQQQVIAIGECQQQRSLEISQFNQERQNFQAKLQDAGAEITQLQQQCRRLRAQLHQQSTQLTQDVKQGTFEQLQTLLMNFPTACVMAEAKPNLPAQNFIPLFTPLKNLLKSWGYEPIGEAWAAVNFDPQLHQPDSNDIGAGDLVYIRFVGYREGDRILCPAKVSRTLPRT